MVNRLLLEKAHVSKVVKKLQEMGLITITTVNDDKRSFWLSTTKKGEQILEECIEIFDKWNKEWLLTIDEIQLTSILGNLTQL